MPSEAAKFQQWNRFANCPCNNPARLLLSVAEEFWMRWPAFASAGHAGWAACSLMDRTKVRKQESFSVSPRVDRIWHCRSALLHFLQHIVWSIEAGIPIKLQAHILLTMVVCACPDTSSCHYRSLEPLVLELSKWHHPFNDLGLRQIMAFLEMVRGALHLLTIVSCHPFEGWFKETW